MAKKKSGATEFGKRLKAARETRRLSQTALAALCGMGRVAVAKLETSPEANPTIETVRLLAKALDCPMSDLIGE